MGLRYFGPVIPIAAFFYLGDSGFTTIVGEFLPKASNGIVNDLGVALASVVPLSKEVAAVTLTVVGAITGLDGSGFSGISLTGSIASLFATAIDSGAATLTALGQISAIWVGGGTLVPWALMSDAPAGRRRPCGESLVGRSQFFWLRHATAQKFVAADASKAGQ